MTPSATPENYTTLTDVTNYKTPEWLNRSSSANNDTSSVVTLNINGPVASSIKSGTDTSNAKYSVMEDA